MKRHIFNFIKNKIPKISSTELIALRSGTTSIDRSILLGRLEFPNVSIIDKYGFYVPNHPHLTKKELSTIINIVNEGINV